MERAPSWAFAVIPKDDTSDDTNNPSQQQQSTHTDDSLSNSTKTTAISSDQLLANDDSTQVQDADSFETLSLVAQELRSGVNLKDRSIKFKKYNLTWKIQEGANWLIKNKNMTIGDAYNTLQKLLDADLILAPAQQVSSVNSSDIWKFVVDEPITSISAKALLDKKEDIGFYGTILYKGNVFWGDRFMALNQTEKKLYIFNSDKSQRPNHVVDLTLAKIVVAECACKTGWYCWTIVDGASKKKHSCCTTHSKDQIAWLDNITKSGGTFEEEDIKSGGSSIFDFSGIDIDGNNVDFSKFRGKVCIVTNIASF